MARKLSKIKKEKIIYKEIDWSIVKHMFECKMEIAQVASTLEMPQRKFKSEFSKAFPGITLKEFTQIYYSKGSGSLLVKLMEKAMNDEGFAALKFALSNFLGMSDKQEVKNSFDMESEMAAAEKNLEEM